MTGLASDIHYAPSLIPVVTFQVASTAKVFVSLAESITATLALRENTLW